MKKKRKQGDRSVKKDTAKLTDLEVMLKLARESLALYGTALPPGFSGAARKLKPEPDWTKEHHKCPRCKKEGPIDPLFGTRLVRGVRLRQSYCSECRANLDYRKRPRVYSNP
jgi:hypothetical protein